MTDKFLSIIIRFSQKDRENIAHSCSLVTKTRFFSYLNFKFNTTDVRIMHAAVAAYQFKKRKIKNGPSEKIKIESIVYRQSVGQSRIKIYFCD